MKQLYWLRRLSVLLAAFAIGAIATGDVPVWLKVLLAASMFGVILIYDLQEYEVRKEGMKK